MLRRTVILLIAGAGLIALLFAARAPETKPFVCNDAADPDAVNVVRHLSTGEDGSEIELWSLAPFPVRAMPTTLRVGAIDVSLSTFRDAGSLHSITFFLSEDEFGAMRTGDPILVHHGFVPLELERNPAVVADAHIADVGNVWTFGRLDKSQLGCQPLAVPSVD